MEDKPSPPPWLPKPFSVAVLDGDAWLGDSLARLLRERGLAPTVFYSGAALLAAQQEQAFDAYVLDTLADWPAPTGLEAAVAAARGRDASVPVFILGNQTEPERVPGLAEVLMRHKVRYVLRPTRTHYIAEQLGLELMRYAGL